MMQERMGAFEDDMTQVLIPFIDKTFRTLTDRDHRASGRLVDGWHGDVPGHVRSSRPLLVHRADSVAPPTCSRWGKRTNWIQKRHFTARWQTRLRLQSESIFSGSA